MITRIDLSTHAPSGRDGPPADSRWRAVVSTVVTCDLCVTSDPMAAPALLLAVAAVLAPATRGSQHPGDSRMLEDVKASSCDVMISSDTVKNGTVTSPSFPNPYAPRSHCRYDFRGRGKERVQLVFTDFNLYHPTDDSKECESIDSLMAYVQIEGRLEKIDNFCGSSLPKPLMSNGPRLMLEFRGIYSSRYARGFRANYVFTENFGVMTGVQHDALPCAFMFNSTGPHGAPNGTFSSPNFPGFYPRDTECHYFFHGDTNQRVRLHFHYFDVEGVLPCEATSASDYVEFSNFMARDRKYSRHCGQLKDFEIESDRKFFRVTFWSNDRLDGTGFNASYQFIDDVDTANTVRPTAATGSAGRAAEAAVLQVWWLAWTWLLLRLHG